MAQKRKKLWCKYLQSTIRRIKIIFRYLQFALPDRALQCQENLAIRPMKQSEPGLKYLTIDGIKLLLEQPDIKPNTVAGIWLFSVLCTTQVPEFKKSQILR